MRIRTWSRIKKTFMGGGAGAEPTRIFGVSLLNRSRSSFHLLGAGAKEPVFFPLGSGTEEPEKSTCSAALNYKLGIGMLLLF